MDNQQSNNNKNQQAKEDDLYLDDNNTLQTKEEYDEDKGSTAGAGEKATPLSWDDSPTLADKITVNSENEDILTPVVDDNKTGNDEKNVQ